MDVDSNLRSCSASQLYTAKIIKAGALLPDTKTLLAHWNPQISTTENLQLMRSQNLLGKDSRSRVEDVLAIFRQRYLVEDAIAKALARLVKNGCGAGTLDRILYFHAVRADSLLHDVVTEMLVPQWSRGVMDVNQNEIRLALRHWVEEGKTSGTWGDYTLLRVTRGILSTLRDFGVLQGAVKKRIAPAYLSVQAFSYIAFYLKQHEPSGLKLIDLPDWKPLLLPPQGVERFLLEAHQHGLLDYHAAGSVTRLTFPASSLEEYADAIAKKSN